jgi:TRAP-type mannitol/chloroaromatic compound transport system permease small subunit
MRKKRLAFTKFALIMAVAALLLVDKPTANCVFPLIVSSVWNTMKLGTQIGYNLTPEKFFYARTFLSMYNLVFLIAIWYKLRQSRKDKLNLEFTFYQRVEGIMLRMSNIFND